MSKVYISHEYWFPCLMILAHAFNAGFARLSKFVSDVESATFAQTKNQVHQRERASAMQSCENIWHVSIEQKRASLTCALRSIAVSSVSVPLGVNDSSVVCACV